MSVDRYFASKSDGETLAQNVKMLRARNGWTQIELANRAGLALATVKGVENCWHHYPYQFTLDKLCKALNVTEDILTKPLKFTPSKKEKPRP